MRKKNLPKQSQDLRPDKVVFTNGTFDLFHAGHAELLLRASLLGRHLVVAVNSDESVRRLKGNGRPFFPLKERLKVLHCIRVIDDLRVFEEDTPIEVIKTIKPDVIVKGGDYKPQDVVGYDFVTAYGGEVKCIEHKYSHIHSSEFIRKWKRKKKRNKIVAV